MDKNATQKRIEAGYQLLQENTTTRQKFELIRTLLKGINPKIDQSLETVSKLLSDVEKISNNEIIELSAEYLPENTDEEKRRKKALLSFIKNWKQLRSEVERVRGEFENEKQGKSDTKAQGLGKIIVGSKGPFGIVTIVALVIVGTVLFFNSSKKSQPLPVTAIPVSSQKQMIKVLEFNGKQIPLSELAVRNGPDCDSPHYHALNHVSAKALDGTVVSDPGGCAFGKIREAKIIEREKP